MAIKVQCECGTEFDLEVEDRVYRANGHHTDTPMGKQNCPNPDCNKTIYVYTSVYSGVAFEGIETKHLTKGKGMWKEIWTEDELKELKKNGNINRM